MHPADEPGPMVFVDDLAVPELADDDRHHLTRVLRVRPGEAVLVGDGKGRWRTATLGTELEVTGPIVEEGPPAPVLTVGFALVKGAKPELIVQKLTELGIDRIVPFRADRSIVRWDDEKAAKAIGRLRAVARAAAMQSHRPTLPTIDEVADLSVLTALEGAALTDRTGVAPTLDHPLLLVGPEGGWSPEERSLGAPVVALGDHVLRAETAAVTAGVLLTALRAGIVASPS
ncbi:MAG: RsmE family RNA methyltransferase [Acidimicrobiales bacterium]